MATGLPVFFAFSNSASYGQIKNGFFYLLATRLALWLKPKLGGASDKQIKNGFFSLLATRLALWLRPS